MLSAALTMSDNPWILRAVGRWVGYCPELPVLVLQDWLEHASVMPTMAYTKIMGVDGDVYFRRIAW